MNTPKIYEYRHPSDVLAMQVTDDNIFKAAAWVHEIGVHVIASPSALNIDDGTTSRTAASGDWIVHAAQDEIEVYSHDRFVETFQESRRQTNRPFEMENA